ncbi:MAG TPA: Rossmann-like and DUF2520 domain-containing protein, partial [Euzebya sp.]|nr:Rossmann-like and DUF2520 domain-containing protein [Euzebya sp.]
MRVAVIGPGRVGGALAIGLQRAGHDIAAAAGRSDTSPGLARFAELFPTTPIRPLTDVTRDVDLVLLTTPDDDIARVAGQVALADAVIDGQRWVHTAGGQGVEALSVVAAAGGRVAACHPAMTFTDPVAGADRLPGTTWAVTAAERDLSWARLLVLDLRGSPVTLAGTDRTLYHAGMAVGSNATTAVVTLARDLLLGAGVTDPASFLDPVVTASAQGGAQRGVDALTGPVQRGDVGTVQAHLRELRTSFPEAVEAYVALGRLILSQAVRAGLDADAA